MHIDLAGVASSGVFGSRQIGQRQMIMYWYSVSHNSRLWLMLVRLKSPVKFHVHEFDKPEQHDVNESLKRGSASPERKLP